MADIPRNDRNHEWPGRWHSLSEYDRTDRATDSSFSRRSVLRAGALAGAATLAPVPFGGVAAGETETGTIDDTFDTGSDELEEALVVFDSNDDVERLGGLDLERGFYAYEVLPIGFTALSGEQVKTVAGWEEVRRVKRSEKLGFYNDETSRTAMAVDGARELGYDGSGVDAVVIDSGVDGSHPDLAGRIESNWQWVDDPLGEHDPTWTNLGAADTDTLGHGQHCSGILAGDGTASDGQYVGMAPGARLSVYSTDEAVYLPYAVGAWDHLLARTDDETDFDPVVVSNSYGVARDVKYNPNDPINVATWEAYQRGIVPVFAMGNSGPDTGTGSRFAKAPHVLGVAATKKDKRVTEFSSRGRAPDRIEDGSYDRKTTLENLERFHAAMDDGQRVVNTGTYSGTLGPAANAPYDYAGTSTKSEFHELDTYPNTDVLELTLSLSPDDQQVRVSVHEDAPDGEIIAQLGEEPVYQHRTLTTDVAGGRTYYVEAEPRNSVAVEYELEYETFEKLGSDPSAIHPVTLFRPGIGTHGNAVMSTFDPQDALAATAPDAEPYYGRISGTSMACPAAAGICALVVDAARTNGYGTPDPIDTIATVEATAEETHESYTPANIGAGFVDAEAAVKRAAAGDLATLSEVSLVNPDTPTTLSVSGSRADDGSAFTAGQTDEVTVTVESVSHEASVRDTVPTEWTVLDAGDDVARIEETNGRKYVVFAGTVAPGSERTFSYFVEAPDSTGAYDFGPAEADAEATDDGPVAFGGTETNAVVGADTNV